MTEQNSREQKQKEKCMQHGFEVFNFRTPTFCSKCEEFIWGLHNQGHRCFVCGFSVHNKCLRLLLEEAKVVFSVPLNEIGELQGCVIGCVPSVFKDCIEYLRVNHKVEGLFRLAPERSRVQALKSNYNRGMISDIFEISDPHVVAELLKLFLRELPEPLFTYEKYDSFIAAAGIKNEKDRLAQILNLIQSLPSLNRAICNHLFHLLHLVAVDPENRMDGKNLAIVMGPSLLRSREEDTSGASMTSIMNLEAQYKLLVELIAKADTLMPKIELLGPTKEKVEQKRAHQFQRVHFNRPTFCKYCNSFIWGVGKQGLACTGCGYPAHNRCLSLILSQPYVECPGFDEKAPANVPEENIKSHAWKKHHFGSPTYCGYCGEFIWGLGKQGKKCTDCGYPIHHKCESLVPSDCGKVIYSAKRWSERQSTSSDEIQGREKPSLEILELLGQGTFSEVFKAKSGNDFVALKKFTREYEENLAGELEKFVKQMTQLKHPNVIAIKSPSLIVLNQEIMLTMELAAQNLEYLVFNQKMAFSPATRTRFLAQIAQAMFFLHSFEPPILHYDLKLANIMMIAEGDKWVAKVSDIGLSYCINKGAKSTATSLFCSPVYLAPEVLQGEPFTTKSDVYSFAILAWELLSSKKAYFDEVSNLKSYEELVSNISAHSLRPSFSSPIPPKLEQMIDLCWKSLPDERLTFLQIIRTHLENAASPPSRRLSDVTQRHKSSSDHTRVSPLSRPSINKQGTWSEFKHRINIPPVEAEVMYETPLQITEEREKERMSSPRTVGVVVKKGPNKNEELDYGDMYENKYLEKREPSPKQPSSSPRLVDLKGDDLYENKFLEKRVTSNQILSPRRQGNSEDVRSDKKKVSPSFDKLLLGKSRFST